MARLLLIGGGHAHMTILAHLGEIIEKGHEVCVIQPSNHHYYSGMGPGMLSTLYKADDIRFNTRFVVERSGARFVRAKAVSINPEKRAVTTDEDESIPYDVLSCNAGSFVPFTAVEGKQDAIFSAKPIERLQEAQKKILSLAGNGRISISVIGGGPAAIELAGNAHHLAMTTGCRNIEVRMCAGKTMLKGFSLSVRRKIRSNFKSRGIIIDETGYVEKIEDNTIYQENGATHSPDVIFLATGVKPSALFKASGLATGPDGGLKVNEFLQSTDYPNIFGGGDCIHFTPSPLDKVGVYAVRQNPVLLHNVCATLDGTQLEPFDPGGGYLLIFNLGSRVGVLKKGPLVMAGRLSFFIKDYIDRKFMDRFQLLEK